MRSHGRTPFQMPIGRTHHRLHLRARAGRKLSRQCRGDTAQLVIDELAPADPDISRDGGKSLLIQFSHKASVAVPDRCARRPKVPHPQGICSRVTDDRHVLIHDAEMRATSIDLLPPQSRRGNHRDGAGSRRQGSV